MSEWDPTDFGGMLRQMRKEIDYLKRQTSNAFAPPGLQELGPLVDLNDIKTPGDYHQRLNASATSGANYPVPIAGLLVVRARPGGDYVYQTYHTYGGANGGEFSSYTALFHRTFGAGTWSPWYRVNDSWAMTPDTGWIYLPTPSAVSSGYVRYRCLSGKDVEVQINISGSFPVSTTRVETSVLPAAFRPDGSRRGIMVLNASPDAFSWVASSGSVNIFNATGGTRTGGEGTVRYMI